jgi:hypothetical protein
MKTALLLCVCSLAILESAEAVADDKAACVAAASQGQTLRDERKLVEALSQFTICARQECPSVVRRDCTMWHEQVKASLPTVVPVAVDAAGDGLPGAKVSMDGNPLLEQADGRAVDVNPGTHTFTFEAADGTKTELQVVVMEGQKDKRVAATMGKPREAAVTPPATPAASAPAEPSPVPWKTIGLVTAGIGVVGLGIGTVFGVQASSKKNSAGCDSTSACPNHAALDTLHDAHSAGDLSTVFFAAGGVLAAAGITMWVLAPSAPLRVAPSVGLRAAGLSLEGSW